MSLAHGEAQSRQLLFALALTPVDLCQKLIGWLLEMPCHEDIVLLVSPATYDAVNWPAGWTVKVVDGQEPLRQALAGGAQQAVAVLSGSLADHRIVVRQFAFQPQRPMLLALHWPGAPVARSLVNHWRFNKATDVNLFVDLDAKAFSGQPGYLGVKNPVVLTRPEAEGISVSQCLRYTLDALLGYPQRALDHRVVRDYSDLKLSYITHFYCNQNDISSVTRLLERYAAYPADVRAQVQFVIVDDGSPIQYQIPQLPINLTWIKVDQDIRWNQAGARNVGVVYARADTILLTDLDHELPVDSMRKLIARGSCGKRLYKMYREEPDTGRIYKGHSNFFVMSRGRFFECFGYDEEFAGHYGAEDQRFVKYHKARGTFQCYLPKSIRCFERQDIDRKRSYHSLARDLSFNTPVDSRKRRELAEQGMGHGHSRMFLNFTWTILMDQWLGLTVPRPLCRRWKWLSIWRQIMPRF